MNGQITLSLPPDIDESLKQLWLSVAGDVFKEMAQKQQAPRYMNQKQASIYMGVSENTFKTYINQGLACVMVGGITRFDKVDCDKFYQEHKQ